MIALDGACLVHLGGWRGDRLAVARDGGPLEPLAELGWDARSQTTPQRRIALHDGRIFVLEPASGPEFTASLRVRVLDPDGTEVERREAEGVAGEEDAVLAARAEPLGRRELRVVHFGIDFSSGRPLVHERRVALPWRLRRRLRPFPLTPLRRGGAWWYPLRMEGLVHVEGGHARGWRGEPAVPVQAGGRVACPGVRRGRPGVWLDGAWQPLAGPRLFGKWRAPWGRLVARRPQGGLVVLRSGGGKLPAVGGPPGRLPPGAYSDLACWGGRVVAVAEGEQPRLVPVGF